MAIGTGRISCDLDIIDQVVIAPKAVVNRECDISGRLLSVAVFDGQNRGK